LQDGKADTGCWILDERPMLVAGYKLRVERLGLGGLFHSFHPETTPPFCHPERPEGLKDLCSKFFVGEGLTPSRTQSGIVHAPGNNLNHWFPNSGGDEPRHYKSKKSPDGFYRTCPKVVYFSLDRT
jgi:hypothetical protein